MCLTVFGRVIEVRGEIVTIETYGVRREINTCLIGEEIREGDWLLWYNTERRHHSLNLISPLRYIVNTSLNQNSHLGWTNTQT